MDQYGIGQAVAAVVNAYFVGSRRSGRTTFMVAGLKDGDRVVVAGRREGEYVQKLARKQGLTVSWVEVDPGNPFERLAGLQGPGRYVFDHSWVERFYLVRIERAQQEMAELQGMLEKQSAHWENLAPAAPPAGTEYKT